MNISSSTAVHQTQKSVPPGAQLMEMVGSVVMAQAIYLAAKLDIAGLLKDGPKSAEFLAVATTSNEDALYRVLRALAAKGVFVELGDRVFSNTEVSETLQADHRFNTRDLTLWMLDPDHWKVYSELGTSVKTGEPVWEKIFGQPVFQDLFHANKPLGDVFNRAMTSYSQQTIPGILAAYDFSEFGTVADIAGGYGHLLGAVLDANPNCKGVLFDLPEVLTGAPEMLERYRVTDRVELVVGDFCDEIPVIADAYMLKHIIHDWYDEKCQKILGNIRRVMPDNARVLIIDSVISEGNSSDFGKVLDIEMLLVPGGKERTENEFRDLLGRSGFELVRIIRTPSPVCIVEAVKA